MTISVTPIPRVIDLATPALTLGTSNAAGSAQTAISSDSTLLVFDTSTPAPVGSSGSVGSATTAPRRDHVHAGATLAAPSLTLGTSNSGGDAGTTFATNSTIAAFDATVPTTIAYGDSAAAGSASVTARRDHTHGMVAAPASAAPQAEMEAASSTTTFVTPGRTQNHPGVVKSWVKITGSNGSTEKSYNTTSTSRSGTGTYVWTIATDLSATDYIAMSNCEGDADRTATSSVISATVIHVFTRVAGTLTDLSSHNLSLGDQ